MALSDAIAGALRPGLTITWTQAGTTTAEDLTGATITGSLRDLHAGETRAIAGVLTVTDAANGIFTWAYDAADVVAGAYQVQFEAAFGAGASPSKTFLATWIVRESI